MQNRGTVCALNCMFSSVTLHEISCLSTLVSFTTAACLTISYSAGLLKLTVLHALCRQKRKGHTFHLIGPHQALTDLIGPQRTVISPHRTFVSPTPM